MLGIAVKPADKSISVLCGLVGLCCRCAASQDLLGIFRTVDLIGYGYSGNSTVVYISDTTVERTSRNCAVVIRNTVIERAAADCTPVGNTAVECAAAYRAAVNIHSVRARSACRAIAYPHIAADVECSFVKDSAAVSNALSTQRCRLTVADAAAVHIELTDDIYEHAAAVST